MTNPYAALFEYEGDSSTTENPAISSSSSSSKDESKEEQPTENIRYSLEVVDSETYLKIKPLVHVVGSKYYLITSYKGKNGTLKPIYVGAFNHSIKKQAEKKLGDLLSVFGGMVQCYSIRNFFILQSQEMDMNDVMEFVKTNFTMGSFPIKVNWMH